jgi:outer membrane protein OmpA-like peptidoglycan-associated protein
MPEAIVLKGSHLMNQQSKISIKTRLPQGSKTTGGKYSGAKHAANKQGPGKIQYKSETATARPPKQSPNPTYTPIYNMLGNLALQRLLQAKSKVTRPGDRHERQADKAAKNIHQASEQSEAQSRKAVVGSRSSAKHSPLKSVLGSGEPMASGIRREMENKIGYDFSQVRIHKNSEAAESAQAINARAYTVGDDIAFGSGQYAPQSSAGRQLLAHELTHVTQQRTDPGLKSQPVVQRDLAMSLPVTHGGFEINMRTREDLLLPGPPPGARSGMSGTIAFEPSTTAPYSNQIKLIQIARDIDTDTGNPAAIGTLPAGRAPALRTTENVGAGIEGDFFVDVLHRNPATGTNAPPGSALPLDYPFGPGGGSQTLGYKRSADPADIKRAEMFDFPGTGGVANNRDFSFETVARGEDTMTDYGSLSWGFGIRAGNIINEFVFANDAASATFGEAVELHREFYVHEPVTFYFGFDQDRLDATEIDKIDTFLGYLTQFPDVQLELQGFADIRGSRAYNLGLADRRANAVAQALLNKGIDATRITLLPPGGETTQFTQDVRAGRSQDLEAQRRGNRRVTLTFQHTMSMPGP